MCVCVCARESYLPFDTCAVNVTREKTGRGGIGRVTEVRAGWELQFFTVCGKTEDCLRSLIFMSFLNLYIIKPIRLT